MKQIHSIFTKALLVTLLLTMTAQTAWAAETVVTLSEDNEIAVGTAGHYYVNMASSGTTTLTLSDASITTFKVYDDGGKNNHYAYTGNSFLKITVPIGYVMRITGSAKSEDNQYDYWCIYNGHVYSDGILFNGNPNPASINVQTTGYKTAIYFHKGKSSYSDDTRNLELTVTLIPDPTYAKDIGRANVSGMESVYSYTGSELSASYSVYSYIDNELLTKGTDYTETITKDGVETEFKEEGYYTLTITGKDPYFGSQSFTLRIKNDSPELRQDGSEWFVNMPFSGTYTPTINSNISTFKIYDDGGKGGGFNSGTPGNFTPGADGYLQIHAPSGYQVRLTGYVRTRSSNAYLTVYDGSSTSASTLCENVHGKNTGADTDTYNNVTVDVASSGEDMLLHFDAHEAGNSLDAEGLILTVSIFPPNSITVSNATGGTIAATVGGTSASTAKMNDVVTLTATPESGYVLSGISATDGSSNAVDINWSIWANTATFIMPPSAVTVTPTFTNAKTAADGLNIAMIETGEQTATIPEGVQSFHVDYDYSIINSATSKLTMTAPEGYLLQLSGTANMTGTGNASFRVYDGDDVVNDTKLIDSSSSGNYTGVVSTGNVMTIYCWTSYTDNDRTWNLDVTVNVVTANNYNDVVISNSIANGQVVSDKNPANVNETVTLTATPAEGYVLQSISVTDGAGAISLTPSATDATWGDACYYTANEFTFKMRSSDATVNATFMPKTDFYVNMPKTDQRDFTIPDGTTSFKVYDNSGKNESYTFNDDGKLLLTAPEGYVMNVSGYVKLYYSSDDQDYLDIYDGNSTSATSLGRFKDTSGNNNTFTQTLVTATSSTNQMLLHFVTNGYGYASPGGGVYLTVTLAPKEYSITYNGVEGATFSTTYDSYTIESAAITLDTPSKTGYDFGGWYDNEGLTGDAMTTIAAGSTGDVVLWAKWTPTFTGGLTLAVVENKLTATLDGTALTELSIPTDITVESVVLNREFASGKCATIMLPFSMDVSNISGTNFYTFGGVEKNSSDKWIATMNQVTGTLTANTPYLVEPTATTLTFTGGATLNTTGGGQQTADAGSNWTFKGTYAARYWYDGTDGVNAAQNADEIGKAYGFAGVQKTGIEVGDFVKVASGAKIRPMGCYLLWSDTPNAAQARRMTRGASASELPQRITVRLVSSVGETTSIGELDTATGEISTDGWWTLDGVKLSGKPAKKGLYIHNGRKEVLK